MKILNLIPAFFMASLVTTLAETVSFDDAKKGAMIPGWLAGKTGTGESKWTIETDETAPSKPNVLKQSGEAAYPLALKNDTHIKDGFVEAKFKPVSGMEDQAAGIIWRAKDADNYYIARANALENNVRIYHFINGKRTQFKGMNIKVASGEWHTLRVDFTSNRFSVIFNGQKLFEAEDDKLTEGGKVGLWTKADSVTLFDDFKFGGK